MTLKYRCIKHGPKSFEIIINVLVSSFRFYLCYGSTVIIHILMLSMRESLLTSESDVYRRQTLTSEVCPRTEYVMLIEVLQLSWLG